jgi:N-acetyl sugar amidotransferase
MVEKDSMTARVCARCVMDTTDAGITFDEAGVCDNCRRFERDVVPHWHTDEKGKHQFESLIDRIRRLGRGKKYDSIIGLSGGLDSSYLLHVAVTQFKLKPLVFHVDGGWNTDLAVENIQSLIEKLDLELMTEVINWKEMRDLQLAFFKAGVPHVDLPQDHAFVAALYKFALKHNIKVILNGSNYSTEGIRNPFNWGWYGTDLVHIRDIHGQFGSVPLRTYPLSGILNHKFYLRYIRNIKVVTPLNYVPYRKAVAEETLAKEYGWRAYPQKHFESRFTRFYEGHWLPTRFGFDTRKPQFSSLIVTGQMTREEALERLRHPAYSAQEVEKDKEFIAAKLRISVAELMSYHSMPLKTYKDYKNQEDLFMWGARMWRWLGIDKNVKRVG